MTTKHIKAALLVIGVFAFVGCASFVNDAQTSIYSASQLADGGMKSYAIYWKWQTNRLGDTASLENQRSNVMAYSFKVGASLRVADRALQDYQNNVGTNSTTKAVVQALIQTAVQDAGQIPGEISVITGDPNWTAVVPH